MQITITLISEGLDLGSERHVGATQTSRPDVSLKGGASRDVGVPKESMTAVERLRAAVNLTADAVKAVSITAMEALREGAAFIGIIGEQDELIDPFHHLDAPIWARDPPVELLKLAYSYCEELTMREAGNFYHSFKYLPEEQRLAMCAVYAFCRRADDIADGDWQDRFTDHKAKWTLKLWRTENNLRAYKTRTLSCKRICT